MHRINVLSHGKVRRVIDLQPSPEGVYTLLKGQSDLVDHLFSHKRTLNASPTGSGKSVAILTYAADRSKKGLGTIILVPKLSIASGFKKYTDGKWFKVKHNGKDYRIPQGMVTTLGKTAKTSELLALIRDPMASGAGKIIICSYQAFSLAINSLTSEELIKWAVVQDEGHHNAIEENGTEQVGTTIGSTIDTMCDWGLDVHIVTATPFRTDGMAILPPRHAADFHRFHITLQQHYRNGGCPDFDIHVEFYDKVKADEHDKFSNFGNQELVNIGSADKLIKAYVRTYLANPLQTLAIVPAMAKIIGGVKWSPAAFAKKLQDAFLKANPSLRILQLGSSNGIDLDSGRPDIEEKYASLNDPGRYDIVIAIKTMDEGSDWPDCAQTFSPYISSSLQLIMQRAVGRAIRRKRADHPSRDKSHIWFFEMGILEEDRYAISETLWKMAVRIKTLCFGVEWNQPFRFKLPMMARASADREKGKVYDSNIGKQYDTDEYLNDASLNNDLPAMIRLTIVHYNDLGITISPVAATELLIEKGILKSNNADLTRLGRLQFSSDFNEFCQFLIQCGYSVESPVEFMAILSGGRTVDIEQAVKSFFACSVDSKKRQLRDMAAAGCDRPSVGKHPLGTVLSSYTVPSSDSYDPIFDVDIRSLAPKWFENTATSKKTKLLSMAKEGRKQPPHRSPLGVALTHYTSRSSGAYDPIFDSEIRSLGWKEDVAASNKAELLRLARSSVPRPINKKHPLGGRLSAYTSSGSKSYDREFDEEIRRVAPEWFFDHVALNKSKLIELAKLGSKRPTHVKHPLGSALINYLKSDPAFANKIRSIAPHWLDTTHQRRARYRNELLRIARSGQPKPKRPDNKALAEAFSTFTNQKRSGYDTDLTKELRSIVPGWFITNKDRLLDLAKTGVDKPPSDHHLTHAFYQYTNEKSRNFDRELRDKLLTLAPHWFKPRTNV